MREKIQACFLSLSDYIPILKHSQHIINEIGKFIKENSSNTHSKNTSQSFFFEGQEYFLTDADWHQIDIKLADALRENINISYNTPQIEDKYTYFFKQFIYDALYKIEHQQPIPIVTQRFHDFMLLGNMAENAEHFSQALLKVLINIFKEVCLKSQDLELVAVKKNQVELALGHTVISSCLAELSPSFLRFLSKELSLTNSLDDIFTSNHGLKKTFKKQIKTKFLKHVKTSQATSFLLLIIAYYIKHSLTIIKNSKHKYKFRTGPFGTILFKDILEKKEPRYDRVINDHITSMLNKLNPIIDKNARFFGSYITNYLLDVKLLFLKKQPDTTSGRMFSYLYITDIGLLFRASRYLCRFSPYRNKEVTFKSTNNILMAVNKQTSDIKINSSFITAHHNLQLNKRKMENIPYILNKIFLLDFLENLLSLLSCSRDELFNNNNNLLGFLSEFTGINFVDQLTNNPEFSEEYGRLFEIFLDFKNLRIAKSLIPTYLKFSKRINGVCLNRKFLANELFFQLHIALHFRTFYLDYFYDFRGRIYPVESLINTYLPFSRNFISFNYYKPLLSDDIHQTNKALLLDSIKTLVLNPKSLNLHKTIQSSLTDTNIKFGERFSFLIHSLDYMYYDDMDMALGFYSLDSSSSGFQITAMNTQSAELAEAANLLKVTKFDIYDAGISYVLQFLQDLNKLRVLITFSEIRRIYRFIRLYDKQKKLLYEKELNSTSKITLNDLYNDKIKLILTIFSLETHIKLAQLYDILLDQNLINLFVSNNFIKVVYKNNFSNDTTKTVIVVKALTAINALKKAMDEPQILSKFKRKMLKRLIMSKFYGGTISGGTKQIREYFLDSYLQSNALLPDKLYKKMSFLSEIIAKIIHPWILTKFPKAMHFVKLIKEYTKKQNITNYKPLVFSSPFFSFSYTPTIQQIHDLYIENKHYRIIVNSLDIDFREIQQSTVANVVQFCDSTICHIFNKTFKWGPCYTIHDRFFCSIYSANVLRSAVADAYVSYFELNMIKRNFTGTPFIDILAQPEERFTKEQLVEGLKTAAFVKP